MTRIFRMEKVTSGCTDYVSDELGEGFIENPPLNLLEIFPDSTKSTPLVFVLSTGADPMSTILRFAAEKEWDARTHCISLGQGQGPVADKLIQEACRTGDWVVLSNCHLAKSWMPKLEKVVEGFKTSNDIHDDFRLWLTSMPVSYFPVPVLQNSIKMTFEPPKGIRANLKGTWSTLTESQWDSCSKPRLWHKMLFGITFFHAVVQERRKFGPLGWNIRYEFNTTDLEVSVETLCMFLDEQENIPWEALLYVTGQIHYGGRVTDDWDRRCLMCVLGKYYNAAILEDGYFFDESGDYFSPDDETMEGGVGAVRKYVEGIPVQDGVGLFGLHQNARITFETQETIKLLDTITALQPRVGGGAAGDTPESMVSALCEKLEGDMPEALQEEEAGETTFTLNEKGELDSLQIVLLHEMTRFNKLLKRVSTTLVDLRKAIKGLVVMSGELDAMFGAMLINKVPGLWEKVSFLSLKPLGSWVKDLHGRVAFFRSWLKGGRPACFAMPAFFFPQGFMTGSLQLHARKYAIPIDTLNYSFAVQKEEAAEEIEVAPKDGVMISGFYMDGARYDREKGMVAESLPKVMTDTMPVIHFRPTELYKRNATDFECPLYKTAVRAGVLSTTGQSTNFVIAVDLPTDRDPNYWVRMGTAMLCALSD
ncbi:dynein heavy chain domain-containing protein [Pavlovales sp. CCMP2436]|nr:dynein heavy chain domain-containing protein [Pavlovales sp. CCMP2436]